MFSIVKSEKIRVSVEFKLWAHDCCLLMYLVGNYWDRMPCCMKEVHYFTFCKTTVHPSYMAEFYCNILKTPLATTHQLYILLHLRNNTHLAQMPNFPRFMCSNITIHWGCMYQDLSWYHENWRRSSLSPRVPTISVPRLFTPKLPLKIRVREYKKQHVFSYTFLFYRQVCSNSVYKI